MKESIFNVYKNKTDHIQIVKLNTSDKTHTALWKIHLVS